MAEDKTALVSLAKDLASKTDLYELISVEPTIPTSEIHRAWRKTALKYHPDRAGAAYDRAKYELFEQARNVLTDDDARAAYDASRAAKAHRARQSEMMSAERRRFKDELEAAERAAREGAGAGTGPGGAGEAQGERDVLREAARRRMEERERAAREADEREREKEDRRIAELERRLREKGEKAKRRAERKRKTETEPALETRSEPHMKPDGEWRGLLGSSDLPFEKRPIYAYTITRLKAAEAQRQERRRTQGLSATQPRARWEEVEDPEVRKYISRVPRFGPVPGTEDVEMQTAA